MTEFIANDAYEKLAKFCQEWSLEIPIKLFDDRVEINWQKICQYRWSRAYCFKIQEEIFKLFGEALKSYGIMKDQFAECWHIELEGWNKGWSYDPFNGVSGFTKKEDASNLAKEIANYLDSEIRIFFCKKSAIS